MLSLRRIMLIHMNLIFMIGYVNSFKSSIVTSPTVISSVQNSILAFSRRGTGGERGGGGGSPDDRSCSGHNGSPIPIPIQHHHAYQSSSLYHSSKNIIPNSSFENLDSFQVNGCRHGSESSSNIMKHQSFSPQSRIKENEKNLSKILSKSTADEEKEERESCNDDVDVKLKENTRLNDNIQNIKSCWKQLYQMMRPGNFPGVVLFHLIGVHRSLTTLFQNVPNGYTFRIFLQTALQPTITATLLALLLIVSSSMLVNDYYDIRSGVDDSSLSKPLASGEVPLPIAKKMLSIMYGTLLTIIAILPGIPARLLSVTGTMMTFYYTKYLKPITWWKNVVCAMLMSLAPLTSGYATLSHPFVRDVAMSKGKVVDFWTTWKALGPLFCSLFCGFMGRELIMDIKDYEEDKVAGIRTVPVRFGIEATTRIVLLFWLGAGVFISMNPLIDLWWSLVRTGTVKNAGVSLILQNTISLRRLSLALIGGIWLLIRALQLVLTKGKDEALVMNAIEEAKLNVLFVLAASI